MLLNSKKGFLFFILLIVIKNLSAQSVSDAFTPKQLTWYGLDFSKAKFVGIFANTGVKENKPPQDLRDLYFPAWNNVIVEEKKKYDLAKFFSKDVVKYNLSKVTAINAAVNLDSMMLDKTAPSLSQAQLEEIISKYVNKDTSGLGLVFVIESFDRVQNLGIMRAVFFDIPTGKIVFSKRAKSGADGMGVRNYWIKSVYSSMRVMEENWKKWKTEAGIK